MIRWPVYCVADHIPETTAPWRPARLNMSIRFSKMHGLGNDFVVIDASRQAVPLSPDQIRFIADRHTGIGCDQVLLVEPPRQSGMDFRYRIFNADGSEAEQCGNGARCFARFVHDRGLTEKTRLRLETAAGPIETELEPGNLVAVNMGRPCFRPAEIPFTADREADTYKIDLDDHSVEAGVVSMGNPHAVLVVEDVAAAPVAEIGPVLENHSRFPRRVNVGFMEVRDPNRIRLRVYERGAGETMACGSGACAAVVSGRRRGLLAERVVVELPGGSLMISWQGEADSDVWMTGPATFVFEGTITL